MPSSAPPFSLRLLGPFEVRIHGQPIRRLRSRKGQWLLALLALKRGAEVERRWLAETLWPDSPGEQSLAYLRQTLTDLRDALGPESWRLLSPRPRTLALDLQGANVDVTEFDAAAASGDLESLLRAERLYRGMLLEGCSEEWLPVERTPREHAYLAALERLARHAAERGDAAQAVSWLRAVVAADPLRERAQRDLMLALSAGGEHAAAALVYRKLRDYLLRELHSEPAGETRALYERLRAEARGRAAAGPAPLVHETPPGTLPHPGTPRPLDSCIGRDRELDGVQRALCESRLVTLTGMGGIGKTRLALELASRAGRTFADGAVFVDLASTTDPEAVPAAAALALGVRPAPGEPALAAVERSVRERELLLILDNCEQVLEACALLAHSLLGRTDHLRVLATSREALRVAGERVWRLAALAAPEAADVQTPGTLLLYPASQLFVERAAATGAFNLDTLGHGDLEAVAHICRRLDGLPLAIELAASRTRSLSVGEISARLDDCFRLLVRGSRSSTRRQQTLQAAFDWSYDLLPEPERLAWRRLAVFSGGWRLDAAVAVCEEDAEEWEVLELLDGLCEKSLVLLEYTGGECRYRMLETVRAYGLERLLEAGDEDPTRDRHTRWCAALVEEAGTHFRGPDQAAWLDRLQEEYENVKSALAWSRSRPASRALFLRMAAVLPTFWGRRGDVYEGREWLRSTTDEADGCTPDLQAKAALGAGALAWYCADYADALRCYENALDAFRRLADRSGMALSLNNLGLVASRQGDLSAARGFHEQSLAIFRDLADPTGIANALNNLGIVLKNSGDLAAARALYEEGLAIGRARGDWNSVAETLNNLGLVARRMGDLDAARGYLQESVEIEERNGNRRGAATNYHNLGLVLRALGDLAAAGEYQQQSLSIARELDDRVVLAAVLCEVGELDLEAGDRTAARAHLGESLRIARQSEDLDAVADVLDAFAALWLRDGSPDTAARLLGMAQALRDRLGVTPAEPDRLERERLVQQVSAALGEDACRHSAAAGAGLSLDEAVSLALTEDEAGQCPSTVRTTPPQFGAHP